MLGTACDVMVRYSASKAAIVFASEKSSQLGVPPSVSTSTTPASSGSNGSGGGAQATNDDTRQVGDCKYASDDMTAIVDVALSRADGAESFTTNVDLAPAYFGGKAKPIEIPGAEKAYLVIADTYDAPVVGILVDGTFAQVQVGVEGATPQHGEQLAATMAARL